MYYTIIYKSKAKENFTLPQIDTMLLKAKVFNKKHGITGCIVYSDQQFVQIIEGQKSEITALYDAIKSDDRHKDVVTIVEKPTSSTLWDDWSMAFYKFSGDHVQDQHNRILLESCFDNVDDELKPTEQYSILKKTILSIIE